jgi:alpha-ketoglutarate-dependent taurine dioxygenase
MKDKALPSSVRRPSARPGAQPGATRRKVVGSSTRDWVKGHPLFTDKAIPFVLQPAIDGVDLIDWAAGNRDWIDELLFEHRALLLRGFGVKTIETFERFVYATSNGELLEYRDRTTPRETRGERIYTSTVHPPDQRIHLHNEGTYWLKWATKLYFFCAKAPSKGGETPIADVRRVYDRIDPAIRERFVQRKMMLVRNFNQGFGLPWQNVFQTEDQAEVERYCTENSIEFEWHGGGRLRTRQTRPAVRKHPRSGEPVWFNHAAFFHYTSLEPQLRDALVGEYGTEGLPYNTCYGDGTPIEPEVADEVRRAYAAEKVLFAWHAGDLMLLDNMTVAHAREPYEGDREVVVSMTDAVDGVGL